MKGPLRAVTSSRTIGKRALSLGDERLITLDRLFCVTVRLHGSVRPQGSDERVDICLTKSFAFLY